MESAAVKLTPINNEVIDPRDDAATAMNKHNALTNRTYFLPCRLATNHNCAGIAVTAKNPIRLGSKYNGLYRPEPTDAIRSLKVKPATIRMPAVVA